MSIMRRENRSGREILVISRSGKSERGDNQRCDHLAAFVPLTDDGPLARAKIEEILAAIAGIDSTKKFKKFLPLWNKELQGARYLDWKNK